MRALARAAQVLETVLKDNPRAEVPGLILAEAALSQALGWTYAVPLLALGVKRGDLRKNGDDLRLACHCAVTASAVEALGMAASVARNTARLNAVASKLRAKGADAAVEMFLTRDAVTPTALASLNSDRAARRFCDRLVALGVVRELTGRDTFRLYGLWAWRRIALSLILTVSWSTCRLRCDGGSGCGGSKRCSLPARRLFRVRISRVWWGRAPQSIF